MPAHALPKSATEILIENTSLFFLNQQAGLPTFHHLNDVEARVRNPRLDKFSISVI
jgi:hypothetical protein